ncbi:MAG TPA: phenylalanine--tRNA ligase subunit alpha [Spirochaetota bacterium]|nr:phenylalanine--tRNA ligase subunit alpha [Spirochaetota bacterium]HPJ40043.1 phenylalanine--tRNA ligase subunit alpha [Spirochaetota bacterium]HPQ54392.1 phenylalanine--tRNA ligase subunit alpha [Spirochaetota bacterium]
MENKLKAIHSDTIKKIGEVSSPGELEEIRIRVLGRKGELTQILRGLGELSPEQRGAVGKLSNEIKREIETLLETRKEELQESGISELLQKDWIDVTLSSPAKTEDVYRGRLHPLSQIQYEIEDIFTSMGFLVLDGPEAETDYYNFEALNIPKHHPARDMQDTFWTEDGNLLRTHTSAIQIRGMDHLKPPFRVIGPGRVFRYESTDASHENTFYQVEGMMVDRNISVSNLIYFMKVLLSKIFGREVTIRLRPGYFPFVEPGFELDIHCLICDGKGCSVCKQSGWVELLPCGLVHPNVLRYGGIDPDQWSGFAFGLGLNRLIMMRYGINDIRHFQSGDIRFVQQF